jgi:hypothetical protein
MNKKPVQQTKYVLNSKPVAIGLPSSFALGAVPLHYSIDTGRSVVQSTGPVLAAPVGQGTSFLPRGSSGPRPGLWFRDRCMSRNAGLFPNSTGQYISPWLAACGSLGLSWLGKIAGRQICLPWPVCCPTFTPSPRPNPYPPHKGTAHRQPPWHAYIEPNSQRSVTSPSQAD